MESELRELLDKIYEMEGLIHLALKRDDSSDDLIRLITKKGIEIGEISGSLNILISDSYVNDNDENKEMNVPYFFDDYSIDDNLDDNPPLTELKGINNIDSLSIPNSDSIQRGKLVFSINERFRYKKELFDNSDADFNNTLALVASMENYDEAEDYFINEEGFDLSNPVVTEFMDVIKRYFK